MLEPKRGKDAVKAAASAAGEIVTALFVSDEGMPVSQGELEGDMMVWFAAGWIPQHPTNERCGGRNRRSGGS